MICAICALLGITRGSRRGDHAVALIEGTSACPDHVSLVLRSDALAAAVREAAADLGRNLPTA